MSIDISNGEFSTYSIETRHKKRIKSIPIVRKNVFTWQALTVFEGIFDYGLLGPKAIIDGLNKGTKILGYDEEITSMLSDKFMKKIYSSSMLEILLIPKNII